MSLTRPATLAFLTALLAAGIAMFGVAGRAEAQDVRNQVGQGWTFMEAGNFRKAEEAFKAAFESQEGKNSAEVYYAIAALWWERRNAMAAYMWLSDAEKASKTSFSWDGGPDSVWDQRIDKRREYIQRHFTAVRLRAPGRGAPLPPQADPPSADPLLREFSDRLPIVIAEGVAEKVAVQWVLLPNGQYWVGDRLIKLKGGELDASKGDVWELPKDGGKLRKGYDERAVAIAEGRSPAAEGLADKERAAVAVARAEEEARVAEEGRLAALAEQREADERAARLQAKAEDDKRAAAERAEADKRAAAERDAEARATAEAEKLATRDRADADKRAAAARDAEARAAAEAEKVAARERADADKRTAAARDEDARLAAEERAAAERESADNRKAIEERARAVRQAEEEARRAAEWDEAQARMREQQDDERSAEAERKQQLRDQRRDSSSGPADDRFSSRRLSISGGGGGSSVGRLTDQGSKAEVSWAAQAEIDYVIRLSENVGLPVGISWANLPVSGCSHLQTRANALALHLGPRIAANLTGRVWLAGRIGAHIGGALSRPTGDMRATCATSSLSEPGVAYGTRLTADTGESARLSLGDLGWNGWAMLVGPDADIGIMGAAGSGSTYVGVSVFLRHDQVLPVIRGTSYHFRDEGDPTSVELNSVTLNTISSRASMARVQFGLRGQILF